MDRVVYSLFALAAQWLRPRYNAKLQLLEAQIRILRSRIDTARNVLKDAATTRLWTRPKSEGVVRSREELEGVRRSYYREAG